MLDRFFRSESGAVTVDWVVLTAAIVGLGVATAGAVRTGVVDLGGDIDTALSDASVAAQGVASFEYGFHWFGQAAYDSRRAQYDAWSNAQLLSAIDSYDEYFQDPNGNSGDMVMADEYAVFWELADERELTVPAGTMTTQDVSVLIDEAGMTPACVSYGCASVG